jgi:LysM repeat protein
MKKILTLIVFLVNISENSNAQAYLNAKDSVFLTVNEFQEKLITHRIEAKQTVYSLGKFYGLKVNEVYYYNPEIDGKDPKIGQVVKIPIPNKAIVRERDKKFNVKNYVPVYYRVQKGEGLKKVAEGYFNMKIDTLKKRNKIWSGDLKLGQLIHIGWISIKGVPGSLREVKGPPIISTLYDLKSTHQAESIGRKIINKSGSIYENTFH